MKITLPMIAKHFDDNHSGTKKTFAALSNNKISCTELAYDYKQLLGKPITSTHANTLYIKDRLHFIEFTNGIVDGASLHTKIENSIADFKDLVPPGVDIYDFYRSFLIVIDDYSTSPTKLVEQIIQHDLSKNMADLFDHYNICARNYGYNDINRTFYKEFSASKLK